MEEIPRKKVLEPRRYQLELVEYVTRRNAIIFLPTGSGKTFVAILALKRFSHEMQNPISEGGKRAIFICNTVELARQQAKEIKNTLSLKVGLYIGDRGVDDWTRRQWEIEIAENQILVGTAQIFVDIINQNYIKLTDLSVVVFDECHHATGGHPMHQFLSFFQAVDASRAPRIIGLTGVLLKGNKLGNIEKDLKALEATFRGNIVTVSNMEEYHNVMTYSTKPVEQMITYSDVSHRFPVEDTIIKIIDDSCLIVDGWILGNIPQKLTKGLAQLKEPNKKNFVKNLIKDFLHQMKEFGLYGASIAIMSVIIELEIRRRQSETLALRNLYRSILTKCDQIRHLLVKKLNEMVDEPNGQHDSVDVILNFSSPKMRSLLMFLKKTFANKNPMDISCLIFLERRYSAKCVYYVLKKFIDGTPELAQVLRPQFMIGHNTIAPGIQSILDRKWSNDAISEFRNKECNLIVCSNVLEEGIDVQACNYVFIFDPLKTFNSYIQTKGRARQSDAHYVVFTPSIDANKVTTQIWKYQQIHDIIKKFLVGRILDRSDPREDEIAEQFVQVIRPYAIPSGACLNAESALQIVSRYCQQLPSDAFGGFTPWYKKEKIDNKVMVSLTLPLQSSLKETVWGEPMETTKLAKMSAALKTCIKLHQLGELNDRLLPVTKRECVANVKDVLFKHWNKHNEDGDLRSIGSKNCRRLYERLSPEELYQALPIVGETCFAYEIIITPEFEGDEHNGHLNALLQTSSNYALLLRKHLPPLAEMPLFMTQGKIRVNISKQPKTVVVTSVQQLKQLRMYHTMLFRDLLECWKDKKFFVIDQRNKQNSYLIAPLRSSGEIDWELVSGFQRLSPLRPYTLGERVKKVYKPEDYLGRIVNTWYSLNESERYVVTKVLADSNPGSPFPNGNFDSYADFVEQKYGQKVAQMQQFLIEVKPLTSRRNFFINAKNKMSKNVSNRTQARIVLIPELCHNFMYPGDMWLKALFLPSILHRINFMLHAEKLRTRINDFLGLTTKFATAGEYQPRPLIIDSSLRRVVDADGNAIDAPEETQKLLPALPTVPKPDSCYKIRSLTDSESGLWKDYMEPENIERDVNSIFPVELDYYYKFISGLVEDLGSIKLDDSEEYTNSQLKISKPKSIVTSNVIPKNCLADVPLSDKQHIKILECSFNKSGPVCSAEQSEFVAALTTAGANDVFDMERFEVLGDSFLKFSASLFLMHKFPKWHEGVLTEVKSKLVSNRNLLYCMLELDIPQRISLTAFKPNSEWVPPLSSVPNNLLNAIKVEGPDAMQISPGDLYNIDLSEEEILSGKCSQEQLTVFINGCKKHKAPADMKTIENDVLNFIYKQSISDKVIADTLEAILGVCVKNYGIQQSFRMLKFFGICQEIDGKSLTQLLELNLGSPLLRTNITGREVDGFLVNYEQLEENLGYKFRDRAYLLQALTHPTFPTNRLTGCYQQLEFIGDAILDFLVSCYIFERCERRNPGELTDLRSALVNNITLGCVCVRHRFHLFLLSENSLLTEAIKNFAAFQEQQDHKVTDQVRILMEEQECEGSMNLAVNIDVPKTLGDIVEALIAAVYLDCRDLVRTWEVIYGLLEQEFNQFMFDKVPIDPVRQLYEYKGADMKFADPIVDNEVVMVKCSFTCLNMRHEVNGFGSNKTNARKSAAKHALQILSRN